MTSPISRLALTAAGLAGPCTVLLASADTDFAHQRAATPLRPDLAPKEHRGKKGMGLPTHENVTMPGGPRNRALDLCLNPAHRSVRQLNAQRSPLSDDQPPQVTLPSGRGDRHKLAAEQAMDRVGWSAVFCAEKGNDTWPAKDRMTRPGGAPCEGVIIAQPVAKGQSAVGNLPCNSGSARIVKPDLLGFAGDRGDDHNEQQAACPLFGRQFGEAIMERPTVTSTHDHDVGRPQLWGPGGKKANRWVEPPGVDATLVKPDLVLNVKL